MITKIRFKKQFQALGLSILTLNLEEHKDVKVSFASIEGMGNMVMIDREGYIGILKPMVDVDWIEDSERKAAPADKPKETPKKRAPRTKKLKTEE